MQRGTVLRLAGVATPFGAIGDIVAPLLIYPHLVELDRAVDHAPASFPPYDVYPPKPEWTPPSGTLSSPRDASEEKGRILLDVCVKGIVSALKTEFHA